MKNKTVCIIGGTGFVGRHLANHLTERGYRVHIPTRRRERHRDMLVNPRVTLVEANVHDPKTLQREMAGAVAVINLAGILNEFRAGEFRKVHVELPGRIVDAAIALGIPRLLHMSALNASAVERDSQYLRTKGEGEDLVHAAAGDRLMVTSFRPSVIFGPGDSFFNRFASLLRMTPLFFPLACPDSRFAPVYVGDVVEAFTRALEDDEETVGKRYELCGPEVYTLRELVEYTARTLGIRRRIIGLGRGLSKLQARVLEWAPGKPFSRDNYYSLQKASVCTENGLEQLGIRPTAIDTIVPQYLGQRRLRSRYQQFRQWARRQI